MFRLKTIYSILIRTAKSLPSTWTTATSLNVSAKGFVTASFLHTVPSGGTFKLRKLNLKKWVEYSGQTTGYQVFDDYSVAHISLVFEAIKRMDLADFNISKIVSPETDTFSVFGNKVTVPSNLSIPDQTLSYIIPFNIAKPGFRVQLETQSDHLMVGLHAEFPVTDLIRGARSNTRTLMRAYRLAEINPDSWKTLVAPLLPDTTVGPEALIKELSRQRLKVKDQARIFEEKTVSSMCSQQVENRVTAFLPKNKSSLRLLSFCEKSLK